MCHGVSIEVERGALFERVGAARGGRGEGGARTGEAREREQHRKHDALAEGSHRGRDARATSDAKRGALCPARGCGTVP